MIPGSQCRLTRSEYPFLLGVILLGALLRLDFLFANQFVIDADEAIVGLMGKHIAAGESIPVFYYGQHYMGSFEPMLVGVLFSIFGVSAYALKAVPLLFSLAFILLSYLIGKELGGKPAARISALLCAVCPATLMVWSAKARGGFIELLFLGALAVLWTLRWIKAERSNPWQLFSIGIILGFGWWTNNQIIYFMVPIGVFVFGRLLSTASRFERTSSEGRFSTLSNAFLMGFSGFLLGGLPFWIYNIQYEFASFGKLLSGRQSPISEHIEGFFHIALPILWGAKRFWQEIDLFGGASTLLWSLYGALFLVLLVYRFREIFAVFLLRISANHTVELLLLLCFSVSVIFCVSSFGYLYAAPRYLLPLYVALFPLLGFTIARLAERSNVLGRVLTGTFLIVHLLSCYWGGRAIPGEPYVYKGERVSKSHTQLVQWLEEKGIDWVRTNYWIGYRLAFETRERVRFVLFQTPRQSRIRAYEDEAADLDYWTMPLVLVPTQGQNVATALGALGFRFKRESISGYDVLYDLTPKFPDLKPALRQPSHAVASSQAEDVALAYDGDPNTRWGSGLPQQSGMRYEVIFEPAQTLRGLEYDFSSWSHDYPRRIRIEYESGNGEYKPLLTESQHRALDDYLEVPRISKWRIAFPKKEIRQLRILQLGEDERFDWSIGELGFYQ